jgi:carbamoyl-phosphate synthase large subunit
MGTSPKSIWLAEDRKLFNVLMEDLKIKQPAGATAATAAEARAIVDRIGFPVLARPSFVLGGRAMKILYSNEELDTYMRETVHPTPELPILIDQYLENATEVDVDCIRDTHGVAIVAGIMQHIEEAGIHSGDSACVLPTISLTESVLKTLREQTVRIAHALEVIGTHEHPVRGEGRRGLRAGSEPPRLAHGALRGQGHRHPFANLATKVMLGKTLAELGYTAEKVPAHFSVKESVFPFAKFHGSDTFLGPEMKSTGEVMGIDATFGARLRQEPDRRFQLQAPPQGHGLRERERPRQARLWWTSRAASAGMGMKLVATSGTAAFLKKARDRGRRS